MAAPSPILADALAAEAAGKQDKYWEMHALIYANQNKLNDIFHLAQQLGLNLETFKADIDDPAYTKKVEDDFESGARSGVNGVPTFFVNGARFNGRATDLYALIKESVSSSKYP